ncbi:MAG: M1 family aminopeptidase [Pyrinomonadaceae bacterium]
MDSLAINIGAINTSSMAKTVLDEALNSVRLYDHYFGKLPHKRIAMTQQPRIGQGQAWATLVFMPYIAFVSNTHRKELFGIRTANNEFWREVGPHEVAHQWWGHTVGWTSYRDQWMSEGFAELSSSLYVQFVYNDTDRFIKYWDDQRDLIVNGDASTKGIKPYTVGPVTQGVRLFNSKAPGTYRRLVYPKGAYILHMLRMLMIDPKAQGMDKDKKFIEMMKDFTKTHYNQDVSTEDFKRMVEKHITPQMDLYQNGSMDWFFDEWVYGTEVPSYEFEYDLGSSGGQTILNAKITQSDVSDRFVMPVPIYVDYGKGWVELGKATIVGNKTYELNNIALPVKPKKVAILALNDVLATSVKNKKSN